MPLWNYATLVDHGIPALPERLNDTNTNTHRHQHSPTLINTNTNTTADRHYTTCMRQNRSVTGSLAFAERLSRHGPSVCLKSPLAAAEFHHMSGTITQLSSFRRFRPQEPTQGALSRTQCVRQQTAARSGTVSIVVTVDGKTASTTNHITEGRRSEQRLTIGVVVCL